MAAFFVSLCPLCLCVLPTDFNLGFVLFVRRGRRQRRAGIVDIPSRTAVALQEVIDVGTRALQRTVRRRNVNLQKLELVRGFRTLVDLHPDTRLLRNDFALAVVGAAARPIAQLLRTGLRAHVLHIAQHAVAACLTSEHGRLHRKFQALEIMRKPGTPIDPAEDGDKNPAQRRILANRKHAAEKIQRARNHAERFRRLCRALVHVIAVLRGVVEFLRQFFPSRSERFRPVDDPLELFGFVRSADVCPGVTQALDDRYHLRRTLDRKSTRLNSSHGYISYAVFCLKKKKKKNNLTYLLKKKNKKKKNK